MPSFFRPRRLVFQNPMQPGLREKAEEVVGERGGYTSEDVENWEAQTRERIEQFKARLKSVGGKHKEPVFQGILDKFWQRFDDVSTVLDKHVVEPGQEESGDGVFENESKKNLEKINEVLSFHSENIARERVVRHMVEVSNFMDGLSGKLSAEDLAYANELLLRGKELEVAYAKFGKRNEVFAGALQQLQNLLQA